MEGGALLWFGLLLALGLVAGLGIFTGIRSSRRHEQEKERKRRKSIVRRVTMELQRLEKEWSGFFILECPDDNATHGEEVRWVLRESFHPKVMERGVAIATVRLCFGESEQIVCERWYGEKKEIFSPDRIREAVKGIEEDVKEWMAVTAQ